MPSSNPRFVNDKARRAAMSYVRMRAAAGEPCAVCGRPIDLDKPQWYIDPKDGKRKRAPWSLECDEIIPLSMGGSPIDRNNVQPTHRVCNQRKGGKKNRRIKAHVAETSREW